MAQWKSSVSLGTHVEQFNMDKGVNQISMKCLP